MKITDDVKRRIVELRENGFGYKEISLQIWGKDTADGTISKVLRAAGMTSRKADPSDVRVVELRNKGMTYKQIANAIGCSKSFVNRVCHDNDLAGASLRKNKRYEAMRDYKAQGHSHSEVAEHFGVSEATSLKACKGVAPQTDRKPKQYFNGWNYEKKEANAIRIIEERTPMFEYVGGFTNTDGFIDVRCKTCGAVIHKSFVSIRHGKARCDNCERIAFEEKEKQKERDRKIDAEKKAWEQAGKAKAKQLSFSICECCGSLFMPVGGRKKYCSVECGNKAHYSVKKDRRLKKLSSVIVDRSITLERLFENSNGKCALCGGNCNWADHLIKDNGAFVAGATYPTIDHIRPISKGGLHEWKNVQLAHFSCNSKKSDAIYPLAKN